MSKWVSGIAVGGTVAGLATGYYAGKKKMKTKIHDDYMKATLASAAKELGYKNFRQVKKLPAEKKKAIAQRATQKFMKQGKHYITFYV